MQIGLYSVLRGSCGRCHGFTLKNCQHLVARAIGNQTAVVEQEQPIDHTQEREAVRRNDNRHPLTANGF